jgi:SAM-dependent methyltransferase
MPDELTPEWRRFLNWLPGAQPMGSVEPMLQQYRDWLQGQGAREEDARAAIGSVMRFMKEREEAWAPLFDRIYASDAPRFRTEANALLVEAVAGRTPGRALDVCTGEGRNAVWLAEQGWEVTGFDVSAEGIAAARRRAEATGVPGTFLKQSAAEFDYASQAWDLVAVFYAPVPLTDAAYLEQLDTALAPDGLIVVESFASDLDAPRRRPVDIDPAALRAAFVGFEIERLDDVVDRPDWVDQPERLVRMIARKPRPVTI